MLVWVSLVSNWLAYLVASEQKQCCMKRQRFDVPSFGLCSLPNHSHQTIAFGAELQQQQQTRQATDLLERIAWCRYCEVIMQVGILFVVDVDVDDRSAEEA